MWNVLLVADISSQKWDDHILTTLEVVATFARGWIVRDACNNVFNADAMPIVPHTAAMFHPPIVVTVFEE